MTRLIGHAWVPVVMVLVAAVRAFTLPRLRGLFSSYVSARDPGSADLIIQFKPKRVICEVYSPAGRVAARALRCWSEPVSDAGDRRVTNRLAKGV